MSTYFVKFRYEHNGRQSVAGWFVDVDGEREPESVSDFVPMIPIIENDTSIEGITLISAMQVALLWNIKH